MVIISEKELAIMKDGVGIVNCARGGVIDEVALVKAKVCRLRCFFFATKPEMTILMHPKVSLTPHIGATGEAQDRIGTELASQIISLLK
jgi:D-3-phosphoglycerate dehydrogenase